MSKIELKSDLPKLAALAQRALAAAGVQQPEQLTKFSADEVKEWHGLGPNAFNQLRQALEAPGRLFEEKNKMSTDELEDGLTPSRRITSKIADLADWRGERLARMRELIHEVAPEITEEWKWGTAVWSLKGNVVAAAAFKEHIKLNFFKGAALADPAGLFNAGLEAKTSRSIDVSQGDQLPEAALKDLIRAAVALNLSGGKKK